MREVNSQQVTGNQSPKNIVPWAHARNRAYYVQTMRALAAATLRWLAELLVRLYYPRRTLEGAEHVPPQGPAIYVANHPNGLLDPLVLRVTLARRIRFLAKSTLFSNPFGRLAMDAFACFPVYRQQDMTTNEAGEAINRNEQTFARCRVELSRGGELALYPEGTSHSDPQLRPLKTGAARLALSAADEGAGNPAARFPTMVPVGLYYREKSTFRSAVHVVVGPQIDLRPYVVSYRADSRHAIDELTALIRERLDELVLQAETRELLAGIARVASWTRDDPGDDAPEQQHARTRELLQAYPRLQERDPLRLADVTKAAQRYARTLSRLGVRDPWQLEMPRVNLRGILGAGLRTIVLFPGATWGALTSWVPYRLAGIVATRMTKDDDVWSTLKMIGGAAFLTAAWLLEAGVLAWRFGAGVGLLSLAIAPISGFIALRFSETVRDLGEAIRHLLWKTRAGETAVELAERRRQLAAAVADALRTLPQ